MFFEFCAEMEKARTNYGTSGPSVMSNLERDLGRMRLTRDTCTQNDLDEGGWPYVSGVCQFHVGGVAAVAELFAELAKAKEPREGDVVLELGSGTGGCSRNFATKHRVRSVTGVDFMPGFVDLANEVNAWPRVAKDIEGTEVSFVQGDVINLDRGRFFDGTVDTAFMVFVNVNISDTEKLASEVTRVLKPGGLFGLYEWVLAPGRTVSELTFPLPFAEDASGAAIQTKDDLVRRLTAAGSLELVSEASNTTSAAADVAARVGRLTAAMKPWNLCLGYMPPPMSLATLGMSDMSTRLINANVVLQQKVTETAILIFRKPDLR